MAKSDFGIPEHELQEIKAFGLLYGTGLGFSMHQQTVFYLYAECNKNTAEIADILGQKREIVRRILVGVLRLLIRYQAEFENELLHKGKL